MPVTNVDIRKGYEAAVLPSQGFVSYSNTIETWLGPNVGFERN